MHPFNSHLATPLFCLLALLLLLLFPHHVSSSAARPKPSTYIIPGDNTFPEGIARQPNSQSFYVGSVITGEIFRGNIYEPNVRPFINGSSYGVVNAVGMKATAAGHLLVAGGSAGTVFVFDVKTKKLLHRFSNGVKGQNETLVNDLEIAGDGTVYITDTVLPVVYRITPQELGNPKVDLPLQRWADLNGTMGGGGNGIAIPRGGRYLLVADVFAGEIWRIDVRTRAAVKVDLGGGEFPIGAPDGLLLRHDCLYSVNGLHSIGQFVQVIEIAPPYLKGKPMRRITSPLFRKPSTAAFDGEDLLVVNFQYSNTPPVPPPVLPFDVVRVPIRGRNEGV